MDADPPSPPHPMWDAVAASVLRIHPSVQVRRQEFRRTGWVLLRNPLNRRVCRVSEAVWQGVRRLDGQRSVSEAFDWKAAEASPVKGPGVGAGGGPGPADPDRPDLEACAALLGSLKAAGMLTSASLPDAADQVQRVRRHRRAQRWAAGLNVMFLRVPVWNPDAVLERVAATTPIRLLFSRWGLLMWCVLLGVGLWHLAAGVDGLGDAGRSLLRAEPSYLLAAACTFVLLKLVHEAGHGLACKAMARREGCTTEIGRLGVMLLVFVPVPFIDVSASWLMTRRRRVVVAAAGMMVELAAAAVAAVVWAHTAPGPVQTLAFQVVLVAGVSTLVFNANPLLKFDGYFIACDLLDTPNLNLRSRAYVGSLVRRFGFGIRRAVDVSQTRGERPVLITYAIAAWAYRLFLSATIVWFVSGRFFVAGWILALIAAWLWFGRPVVRGVAYLSKAAELEGRRARAWCVCGGVMIPLLVVVAALPLPQPQRAPGVVEPAWTTPVFLRESGWVTETTTPPETGELVAEGQTLVRLENQSLRTELAEAEAMLASIRVRHVSAREAAPALAAALADQAVAAAEHVAELQRRVQSLHVRSPANGRWIPEGWDGLNRLPGRHLGPDTQRSPLGRVTGEGARVVRVAVGQRLGPRLLDHVGVGDPVRVRTADDPGTLRTGRVVRLSPAGSRRLPSAALALHQPPPMASGPQDVATASERRFEIEVRLDERPLVPRADGAPGLPRLIGQRASVEFDLPAEPLATRAWRSLQALFQSRFEV